jgi:hypothetical protein
MGPVTCLIDPRLRTAGVEKKYECKEKKRKEKKKRKGNYTRMKTVKNIACWSSIRG